jgi:NADPH:quinone reductase-like Zn-dependent oxidoreductase
MKALCLKSYGKDLQKSLEIKDHKLEPLKGDEVLIDIYVAGLNPVDYKIVHGAARLFNNPPKPFPIGFDLSGKITAVGSEVKGFQVGDEVYAKLPWSHVGSVAEQAKCPEDMCSLKPKNTTYIEAAGLPLVACTVIDSFNIMKIKKGTKILIHAGAGGIGTFAIQYAKHLGATVYTTCSTSKVEFLNQLGADYVIDYTTDDYKKSFSEIDIVYDTLGGKFTKEATQFVKKGGQIISIVGYYDNATLKEIGINPVIRFFNYFRGLPLLNACSKKNIFYKHVWSFPNQMKLNETRKLIEKEVIKPTTDSVFEFENAIAALKYVATNRAKGKVLIEIHK